MNSINEIGERKYSRRVSKIIRREEIKMKKWLDFYDIVRKYIHNVYVS